MSRKLASVQKIKAIHPIEGADKIELVQVLNWDCVAKKGEFKEGDIVLYFEIDSMLPEIPMLEWLRNSSWSQKEQRYKIKTHKFRDQISQGLVVPISQLKQFYDEVVKKSSGVIESIVYPRCICAPREGDDLTDVLEVEKYEPPVSNGPLGNIFHHEWYIPKTDEERIQVCAEDVLPEYLDCEQDEWYASIKLDGTSCTVGLFDDAFLIGGRNYWYTDDNMYTSTVKTYGDMEQKLKDYLEKYGEYIALQGELCGPGIQGNKLGLDTKRWFIFNVFASPTGKNGSYKKCDLLKMFDVCARLKLLTVPIIPYSMKFDFTKMDSIDETVTALLNYVDNLKYRTFFPDASPKQIAEGAVFRKNDMSKSFKVVSNKYLLKGGE